MKRILFIAVVLSLSYHLSYSQGCVAIRGTGGSCTKADASAQHAGGWQLNVTTRYFKSYKHFVGREEQKHRVERQTDVRNWQTSIDFNLVRHLDSRWSIGFALPVQANRRSSLYEHGGKERHVTESFGIGDARITVYRWLLDPAKHSRGNLQAGLGVKLPTGDYKYQDFFHKADSTEVLAPVDQSIQLGDGGTGVVAELNGYYNVSRTVSVYGNFFYLLNPREHNGVSTARGGTPSATAIAYKTTVMSVADQYMARAGANVSMRNLTVSGGVRIEGIPADDLVGGSTGFRRPGYVISAEPGVQYKFKKVNLYATVPVALVRNRIQSDADKRRTRATGTHAQGDAAFADYSINAGIAINL